MNNEIKEILAYFEEYIKITDMHDSEPMLNWKDLKIVLDYITNLQERIDKAIEYIQEEFCQVNKETKELECWHERVKPILDILKGVNNE